MIDFSNQDTFVQDGLAEARRGRPPAPTTPPVEADPYADATPQEREILKALVTPNASEAKLGAEIGKRAVTRGNEALAKVKPIPGATPEEDELLRAIVYTESATPSRKTFGGEAKKNLAEKVPLVGSVVAGYNAIELLGVAKKLERGEASDEDIQLLADRYEEMQGDPTISSRVGDILSNLPGTMVDFMVSGGIAKQGIQKLAQKGVGKAIAGAVEKSAARAGETAAAKAVEKATARMVERGILKAKPLANAVGAAKYAQAGAPRLVEPGIKLAAGALTKSALQTVLMGGRAVASGVERDVGDKLEFGQDDLGRAEVAVNESIGSLVDVLPEGLVDMWIENLSERAGGAIDAIPPLDRLGLLSTRLAAKVAGAKGVRVAEVFKKLGEGAGWHGVISEIGEERFGDLARAAVLGDPLELSGEQLAAEAIAFAVPGATSAVASRVLGRKEKGVDLTGGGGSFADQTDPSGKPGEAVAQEIPDSSRKPGEQSGRDGEAVEVEVPEEDAKAWAKAQKAGAPAGARLQAPRTDEQRQAAALLRGSGVRAYFVGRPEAPAEAPTEGAEAEDPFEGFQGVSVGDAVFISDDLPEGGVVRWVTNHELVHVLQRRQGKAKFFQGLSKAVDHFPELKDRAASALLAAEASAGAGPNATEEQILAAGQRVAQDESLVKAEMPAYAVELMGDLIDAAARDPQAAVRAAKADPGFWKSLLDAVYRFANQFGGRIGLHGHEVAAKWVRENGSLPWHAEADPRKLAAFALHAAHALQSLQVPEALQPAPARAKAPRQSFDSELSQATVPARGHESPPAARGNVPTESAPETTEFDESSTEFEPDTTESAPESRELGESDPKRAAAYRAYAKLQTHYQGHKGEFFLKAAATIAKVDLSDVETVFDLYAGGGTYGLTYVASGAAPKAKRVVINEIDPVRRLKFELARDGGSEFLDLWDTNPLLVEIKAAVAPLFKEKGNDDSRSSSPAARALQVIDEGVAKKKYHEFLGFARRLKQAAPEVQAAFIAMRDVMFSGRTAPLDRVLENMREDADHVRELVKQVTSKGVKVEIVSLDALSEEAIALVAKGGRSLVLLDPPYHETASGTYTAPGTKYKFDSPEFLRANVASGARMAPGNVVLYHNKATNEVLSATARAFGRSAANLQWKRSRGGQEFLGIYDGRRKGRDAGNVARGDGASARAGRSGGGSRLVGSAGKDARGEARRRAAGDVRGAGVRAGERDLEEARSRLKGRAGVPSVGPALAPDAQTESNRAHEDSLKGLSADERRKARKVARTERRRQVGESLAASKRIGDRVRLKGESRIGRVLDITGPLRARRVKVAFEDYEEQHGEGDLLIVERPAQQTRTQQKREQASADDMKEGGRVRFSRAMPKTAAFRRWFEGSAITDKSGKPLRVFRGFKGLRPGSRNTVQDNRAWGGFFFTPDTDLVRQYFESNDSPRYGKQELHTIDEDGRNEYREGSGGQEFFLAIKRPYITNKAFELSDGFSPAVRARLIAEGYDGAMEMPIGSKSKKAADALEIIAFHPTQVKSATGNRGTFDAKNPDIRFSRKAPDRAKPDALGFVSAMENAVRAKMPEKASATQVLAIVSDGVKPEEVEWSGIRKFLGGRATVTKAEVLEFIAANGVTVQETSNAGDSSERMFHAWTDVQIEVSDERQVDSQYNDDLKATEWTWTTQDGQEFTAVKDDNGPGQGYTLFDGGGEPVSVHGADSWMTRTSMMNAARRYAYESHIDALGGGNAKFEQWSLEGPKTAYRELLLVLPVKTQETPGQAAARLYPGRDFYGLSRDEMQKATDEASASAPESFRAGHFNTPNVIAHVRVDTREVDDKQMLFVEEIQSDWHQKGREHGYDTPEKKAEVEALKRAHIDAYAEQTAYIDNLLAKYGQEMFGLDSGMAKAVHGKLLHLLNDADTTTPRGRDLWIESNKLDQLIGASFRTDAAWAKARHNPAVPNAPFKKTWHELAFKRALAVAVKEGHDLIGWTTGAQQIDRYNESMRQNVDRIEVEPRQITRQRTYGITKSPAARDEDRPWVLTESVDGQVDTVVSTFATKEDAVKEAKNRKDANKPFLVPEGKVYIRAWKEGSERFGAEVPLEGETRIHGHQVALEDVVGKDIANKIRAKPTEAQTFEGEGLAIGGKGMQEFYDGMLVRLAQSIAKKYGGEVGKMDVDTSQPVSMRRGEPPTGVLAGTETVHSMTISPELRKFVEEVGFPRFSRRTKADIARIVAPLKEAAGRAFNEGEETEVGSTPVRTAVQSDDPALRALHRGARENREHEVRHRSEAIEEAEIELERDRVGTKRSVLAKARNGDALLDWEHHVLDTLWKDAASKWQSTDEDADLLKSLELNGLFAEARTRASHALSTIRDADMTAADRVMEIITTPGRAVQGQIRRLQKARRSMSRDDPRLARLQARLDKLLADEVKRTKAAMREAKKAGLDPAFVTNDYFGDPYVLSRFAAKAGSAKSTGWDWFIELRIANMLSGPGTQIANIGGNAGHIAFDQVARRFAEAVANTIVRDPNSPTFRENVEFARALPVALANAGRNWFMAYATETPFYERDLQARGVDVDGPTARDDIGPKIPGPIGRLLRLPSLTTLLAFDEFFKTLSSEMELRALGYRAAKASGIEHPDAADIDRVIHENIDELGRQALAVARRGLFQERSEMIARLTMLRRDVDDAARIPIGSILFPFVKTTASIFIRSAAVPWSIPLALSRVARGKYLGDKRLAVKDSAQVALSLGLGWAAIALVGGDDDGPWITGTRSINWNKSDLDARTAPPMSIRLGETYYSYARVEPFATILGTMVDEVNAVNAAAKSKDSTRVGAALGTLVSSMTNQAADKTFLRTVGDLFKIREEMQRAVEMGEPPGKMTARFLRDTMVTPMIPFSSLIRQTTGADEEHVRANTLRLTDDTGIWEAAANGVWPSTMQTDANRPPPKFDLWGRPIRKDGRSYLGRLVGVLKESGDLRDVSDLDQLIVRWNDRVASGEVTGEDAKPWYPSPPQYSYESKREGKHYWSHEQYAALCERAGKLAAERLAGRTLNYETPTERDIKVMRDAISDARARVKKELLREARDG